MTLSFRTRILAFTSRSLLPSFNTILALPCKYSKSISSMASVELAMRIGIEVVVTFLLQPKITKEIATRSSCARLFIDFTIGNFLIQDFITGGEHPFGFFPLLYCILYFT